MSFSLDPVDEAKCQAIATDFKACIDDDVEDICIHCEAIQQVWGRLSNDERSEVRKLMDDKAHDSRRKYKSILSELINGIS